MTDSDRFLTAFADIESSLRSRLQVTNGLPFGKLVGMAASISAEVRRYESDLREFAELRNAIVHDRGGGRVIAEPHVSAVDELRVIADLIVRPPTLEKFLTVVASVRSNESIAGATALMYRSSFSQLPVISDSGFVGLLTAHTVARWLGASLATAEGNRGSTPVSHVLSFAEDPEPYVFVDPATSLARALEHFATFEESGRELAAVLITANAARDEELQGIVTVSDLPRLLRALPDFLARKA